MLIASSSETLSAHILDTAPVAILCLSDDMVVRYANPSAETHLGRSTALINGTRLSDILSEDSPILDLAFRAQKTGGSVFARAIKLAGPNVAPLEVDASAAPSQSDDLLVVTMTPTRSGLSDTDPTRETATMAEVARILGHEVKNPLAGMVGAAQLLSRKARDDQQALLSLIRDEGARIGRIVDRFAAFETFFRPRPSMINIHEVLNSVVELANASFASDMRLTFSFDPSLPEILADPDHIHEACLNLVKNAAEAIGDTDRQGHIHIETSFRAGVRFAAQNRKSARAGAIEIKIRDNGPGIPAYAAEKIFSPFFTTKEAGAGIGLSVVAEILAAHGGFVELDNTPHGVCFRLLLPISNELIEGRKA